MFKRKEARRKAFCFQQNSVGFSQKSTPLACRIQKRLVLVFLIFLTPFLCFASYSAWAAAEGNVLLEIPGIDIEYGGYGTCEMYVQGAPAFCAEPAKITPEQTIYSKCPIEPLQNADGSVHDANLIVATLWFGWGGPGFDPSLWPSTWCDGSAMDAHRYWALTHIVLADFYTSDGGAALAGCSTEFRNWALGNVLSYVSEDNPYVPQAAQSKIAERANEVPQNFADTCFQLNTGSSQTILSYEIGGWIDLDKDSANSSITAFNENYSLENAQYAIYQNLADAKNDSNRVEVLATDGTGYAKSGYLNSGTYYIKETTPSSGYELDDKIYSVEVKNGSTSRTNKERVYDTPAYDTANLIIQKTDTETNSSEVQGNATLENAEFQIRYYRGLFGSIDETLASNKLTRTWTFKTNSKGAIDLTDPSLLVSGELYYSSSGEAVLPIGTYLIQETKAPQGYLPNNEIILRTVKQSQGFSAQGTFAPLAKNESVKEQIIRGGISFNKLDQESLTNTPLGAGKLNAVFDIINESNHSVIVGNKTYDPGEVVYTGQAQAKKDGGYSFATDLNSDNNDYTLPYGNYRIKERMAGTGYLPSQKEITFSIEENGKIITLSDKETFTNQIKRGDIELIKARESDQARLAGIPFKITSETTGESHVVVTDENGLLSTASKWNEHSSNTNRNDFLLNNNTADTDKSTETAEISDKTQQETNEQKTTNSNDSNPEPREDTSENASGSSRTGNTSTDSLVDSSKDSSTDSSANITIATTGIWFGKTQDGTMVEVNDSTGALPFDTYSIEELPCDANKSYQLVKLEGIVVKKDSLTVSLGRVDNRGDEKPSPSLHTHAQDSADEDKLLLAQHDAEIIDRVEYENLTPGKTYTLKTTVYDNDTQELLPETSASSSFTPSTENDFVEVRINVNTLTTAGHSLTVFEELYEEDKLVCEHKDPNDSEQTLIVLKPLISTSAFDTEDKDKQISLSANAQVTDEVTYEHLTVDKEYQLFGFIVNPAISSYRSFKTGDIFNQEILDEVNTELQITGLNNVATSTFSPDQTEGTTSITFDINTEALSGKTFVVFEYLVQNEQIIATHTELNSVKQQFSIEAPPKPELELTTEPTLPSKPDEPEPLNTEATQPSKTNDSYLPLYIGLACALALGVAIAAYKITQADSRKEKILSRIMNP